MPLKTSCILSLIVASLALAAPTRVEVPGGYYLVSRPSNVPETAPAALVVCLHGADHDAARALESWEGARRDWPFTVVALQCPGAAWSSDQAAFFQAAWAHVQRHVDHDPRRVLLAGSSDGAALALRLFFPKVNRNRPPTGDTAFPAVGLALHGGELPREVTVADLAARLSPVIWTIGAQDPRGGAASAGADQMRMAGLTLEQQKVPGDAVPDASTAAKWVAWFELRCRDAMTRFGSELMAANLAKEPVAPHILHIEELTTVPGLLPTDQVERLIQTRADIETPAREQFLKVGKHLRENDPLAARTLLLDLERRFLPSPVGLQALHQRGVLETTTSLASLLRPGNMASDVTPANLAWQQVEAARARGRLPVARRLARQLMTEHPTAPEANLAEKMIFEMDPGFAPPAATPAP